MENILGTLNVYGVGSWDVIEERDFNDEEKRMVSRAEVVESQYGNSVCFHMMSGGMTFIPLSNRSHLSVGEPVDMNTSRLLKLRDQNGVVINRVDA